MERAELEQAIRDAGLGVLAQRKTKGAALPPALPRELSDYACALAARPFPQLTAKKDLAALLRVLVLPSLFLGLAWDREAPPRVIVDLGSGNGFPGVCAAAWWPGAEVHLVERRARKAEALAELSRGTFPNRIRVHDRDVRELAHGAQSLRGCADLITVRAVGLLAETSAWAAPLLRPGGLIVHWKSAPLGESERQAGWEFAARSGWSAPRCIETTVGRQLVCFQSAARSQRSA